MTAKQLQDDAASSIFSDFPLEQLTIGTQTFGCLVPDDAESNAWIEGGNENQPRASVLVARPGAYIPKRGEHAGYRGQQWRIATVKRDHINSPVRIDLEKLT